MKKDLNLLQMIVIISIVSIFSFSYIYMTIELRKVNARLEIATQYITELESVIESDGTVIGDVCGGDGYTYWYNK